jgi:hypothetical protein
MSQRVRAGAAERGGILGYPLDDAYEEVAFIAFHFHWSLEAIMNLQHADRRRWVTEISRLNERANEMARNEQGQYA